MNNVFVYIGNKVFWRKTDVGLDGVRVMARLEKYAEGCYFVYEGLNGLLGKIELYGRGDWIASPARKMSAARHFAYRKEAIEWLVSFCSANT